MKQHKNKFYMVYDKFLEGESCNIVIASTAKEAKEIGRNIEATEGSAFTDIRVKAVKGGHLFWTEEDGHRVEFFVDGSGYVYTDKEPQLDSWWDEFLKELKAQNRYIQEEDED